MIDFKKEIAREISKVTQIEETELEGYIEIPKDTTNGDYAFPCFRLAKTLKKAPPVIASEIKEKIKADGKVIEKIEVAGGYLNFYINKMLLTQEVIQEVESQEEYGKSNLGKDKNIIVEYSSPNIAKPFHIGHLGTTGIGQALYNIYKYLGYNTIGINHLGDYGTQFGKMIEGYKRWGNEYTLEEHPIDDLMQLYVRINNLCKEDEEVLNLCRENFKKLEEGDEYCTQIWEKFKDLSLKEFQKVYDILGTTFDSWNGEAFYTDKMPEVIKILEDSGHLIDSEGAKIIDLEDQGINTPCMVVKSNGSTTYDTRDLAAILYRARTYDFDKCLYVVAYEQDLHFRQIFGAAKYLGLDKKYIEGLEHISYGMVRLKSGKMSTREGTVIKLEDLLNESIARVKKIIEDKNPDLEEKEEVAKKVGVGAILFNNLSTSRIKDKVFDWDEVLNFQGETGPYIQYTYVRTKSVLEKIQHIPSAKDIDVSFLQDEYSQNIIKLIYSFSDILIQVTEKNEPSILARYLIDLSKAYSSFYNENKIICEDKNMQDARAFLTRATGKVLKQGAKLLGIDMPNKM
ncbi:MAG: arginine--tRNA ligase [Clostridia bacterium]|nr:arginine--tRNA ligase [Clostridia bacterium]